MAFEELKSKILASGTLPRVKNIILAMFVVHEEHIFNKNILFSV